MIIEGNVIKNRSKSYKRYIANNKELRVKLLEGEARLIIPKTLIRFMIDYQVQNDFNSLKWPDRIKALVTPYFKRYLDKGGPSKDIADVTGIMESTIENWVKTI